MSAVKDRNASVDKPQFLFKVFDNRKQYVNEATSCAGFLQ